MQTNAFIAALFAAATASGAALKRGATSFNVTGFSASCIPHSVYCKYVVSSPPFRMLSYLQFTQAPTSYLHR